jgi:hypothetical protein
MMPSSRSPAADSRPPWSPEAAAAHAAEAVAEAVAANMEAAEEILAASQEQLEAVATASASRPSSSPSSPPPGTIGLFAEWGQVQKHFIITIQLVIARSMRAETAARTHSVFARIFADRSWIKRSILWTHETRQAARRGSMSGL